MQNLHCVHQRFTFLNHHHWFTRKPPGFMSQGSNLVHVNWYIQRKTGHEPLVKWELTSIMTSLGVLQCGMTCWTPPPCLLSNCWVSTAQDFGRRSSISPHYLTLIERDLPQPQLREKGHPTWLLQSSSLSSPLLAPRFLPMSIHSLQTQHIIMH